MFDIEAHIPISSSAEKGFAGEGNICRKKGKWGEDIRCILSLSRRFKKWQTSGSVTKTSTRL